MVVAFSIDDLESFARGIRLAVAVNDLHIHRVVADARDKLCTIGDDARVVLHEHQAGDRRASLGGLPVELEMRLSIQQLHHLEAASHELVDDSEVRSSIEAHLGAVEQRHPAADAAAVWKGFEENGSDRTSLEVIGEVADAECERERDRAEDHPEATTALALLMDEVTAPGEDVPG